MAEFLDMPGFLIRRAHQTATALFADYMAQANLPLTPFQFAALSAIAAHPGLDQASVATMADCDRATMGGVLDRLAERGLILRQTSPKDRRAKVLDLTPEGAALLEQATPIAAKVQHQLTAGLHPDERKQLAGLLEKIVQQRPA
jgi:DNA-binding MarR family transcriptional regulator